MFIDPLAGKHYSRDINNLWNRAVRKAGVKPIRLYQAVRHSFACELVNLGAEKNRVLLLLRHLDPRMIERYAFYETVTLGEEVAKVGRLLN